MSDSGAVGERSFQWQLAGVVLWCLGVALIVCSFPLFFALYEQIYQFDILGNAQLEVCQPADLYHYRTYLAHFALPEFTLYFAAFLVGARVTGDATRLWWLSKSGYEPESIRPVAVTELASAVLLYHGTQFTLSYGLVVWGYGLVTTTSGISLFTFEGLGLAAAVGVFAVSRRTRSLTSTITDPRPKKEERTGRL